MQFMEGTGRASSRGVEQRTAVNPALRALLLCVCAAILTIPRLAAASDYCTYDFPLDSNPTAISSDDICNFHQVDAQVYRGGRPRPTAFPKLLEIGIRTIIDLEEEEAAAREKEEVEKINLGLSANRQIQFISLPIGPEEIEVDGVSHEKLKTLFAQMRDTQRPIFIHCFHGKDRTGAVVAIYRLLMQQKSFTETYEEAYHYGFSREDHGLSKTVDRYKSPKKLHSLPRPEREK